MERAAKGANVKILLAKVGFDGHDRGVKILATLFRDAGYDVIYLGKYLTVAEVVAAAADEDVDAIGLSFLGGAHLAYCRETVEGMRNAGLDDVALIVGGVIPRKDFPVLEEMGVDAIFPANTESREIIGFLDRRFRPEAGARYRK